MKRLLLTGALVALFSFAGQAHADCNEGGVSSRILTIEVIGVTKAKPEAHPVLRVTLPYPTKYTCDTAKARVDTYTITQWAKWKLKRARVIGAAAQCETSGPNI